MGCRIIIIALITLILLMGVAGAALFHFFGWYALLIIPVAALFFSLFIRVIIKRLILIPFKMKGKVLKDARATVHEVSFTGIKEAEAGEDEGDEAEAEEAGAGATAAKDGKKAKVYSYLIDVTIHPAGTPGTPFQLWDPSELMVVSPDSKASFEADSTDDDLGTVKELHLFENGQWTEEFDKVPGEQRIRLKIHLVKPSPACKLRYYFYDVATVTLPAAV